jgi:hypothetical protein
LTGVGTRTLLLRGFPVWASAKANFGEYPF